MKKEKSSVWFWPYRLVSRFKWLRELLSGPVLFVEWLYGHYISSVINRIKVVGKENLPDELGVAFVANHCTFLDSFVIGAKIIKLKYFFWKTWMVPWNWPDKNNFFGKPHMALLYSLSRCVPMPRENRSEEMLESIEALSNKLRDGNVLMFLEGGRNLDDTIKECKPGVVRVIKRHWATVVPIYIDFKGLMKYRKKFSMFNVRFGARLKMIIGKPVELADLYSLPDSKEKEKKIAWRIRNAVADLAQKNVDQQIILI